MAIQDVRYLAVMVKKRASVTRLSSGVTADGKDDVVGAIWRYTLTRDGKEESGQFRVYQREICKGSEKVGVVEPKDKDETTLTFKNWPDMNGRATLRKIKNGRASGTVKKTKGAFLILAGGD
jgi:hypothetical protein